MTSVSSTQIEIFVVLSLASVAYSVAVRRIERLRRGLTNGQVANVLDVWTMAGALLLPLHLVVALAVTVYAAEWPSRRIVGGGRPRRYITSTVVLTIAAAGASAASHALGGSVLGAAAAIITCAGINDILLVPIIWIFGERRVLARVFTVKNHAVDTIAKLFGVCLAAAITWQLPAAVIALPLIFAAHRLALMDSIKSTGAFDEKTGLWSADGWRIRASELTLNAPSYVVLILIQAIGGNRAAGAIRDSLASLFGAAPHRSRSRRFRDSLLGRPQAGPSGPRETDNLEYALGWSDGGRIGLIAEVDLHSAGVLLAREVRATLRRTGIRHVSGHIVGVGGDFDELLAGAEVDLKFEEITAGVVVEEI